MCRLGEPFSVLSIEQEEKESGMDMPFRSALAGASSWLRSSSGEQLYILRTAILHLFGLVHAFKAYTFGIMDPLVECMLLRIVHPSMEIMHSLIVPKFDVMHTSKCILLACDILHASIHPFDILHASFGTLR